MNNQLTISAKDEKVPFPAAVRCSKTPVLKLSTQIGDLALPLFSHGLKGQCPGRLPKLVIRNFYILYCQMPPNIQIDWIKRFCRAK